MLNISFSTPAVYAFRYFAARCWTRRSTAATAPTTRAGASSHTVFWLIRRHPLHALRQPIRDEQLHHGAQRSQASSEPISDANTPSNTNGKRMVQFGGTHQSHDLGLVLTRGGTHANRRAGQHDGHKDHHAGERHGDRRRTVQHREDRVEDLALILHFLDTGAAAQHFGYHLVFGRVLQFQTQRPCMSAAVSTRPWYSPFGYCLRKVFL